MLADTVEYIRSRIISHVGYKEPLFILRAKDLASPGAIRAWVKLALEMGMNEEKAQRALQIAEEFETWQATNTGKIPD